MNFIFAVIRFYYHVMNLGNLKPFDFKWL